MNRQRASLRKQGRTDITGRCVGKTTRIAIYLRGRGCVYCQKPFEDIGTLTLDHVIPLSHGGLDDPSNLVTACKLCNERKGLTDTIHCAGLDTWLRVQALTRLPIDVPAAARLIKEAGSYKNLFLDGRLVHPSIAGRLAAA